MIRECCLSSRFLRLLISRTNSNKTADYNKQVAASRFSSVTVCTSFHSFYTGTAIPRTAVWVMIRNWSCCICQLREEPMIPICPVVSFTYGKYHSLPLLICTFVLWEPRSSYSAHPVTLTSTILHNLLIPCAGHLEVIYFVIFCFPALRVHKKSIVFYSGDSFIVMFLFNRTSWECLKGLLYRIWNVRFCI